MELRHFKNAGCCDMDNCICDMKLKPMKMPKQDDCKIQMMPMNKLPECMEKSKYGMDKMHGCGCYPMNKHPMMCENIMPQMMMFGMQPHVHTCQQQIFMAYPYMNANRIE